MPKSGHGKRSTGRNPGGTRRMRAMVFSAAGAALVLGAVLLIVILRDRATVLAVPQNELEIWRKVTAELAAREGHPPVKLQPWSGDPSTLLNGRKPGLAVVDLAPWVSAALADGRLAALPADAFRTARPRIPLALLSAVGSSGPGPLRALPLAYDPLMAAWHRDFIGGANALAPRDWNDVSAAALKWKQRAVIPVALAGRETDALLSWLTVTASAIGPASAAAALAEFPMRGRDALEAAFLKLASFQAEGIFQPGSFSYPWADAVGLVLQKRAAGILLPLSRYRRLNPASSAPLIVSRVPDIRGSTGSTLVARTRLLVAPARGARGRGAGKLAEFLADPAVQRELADALLMVPAVLDAPVRDGPAFEAMNAARAAAAVVPEPAAFMAPDAAAAVAAAAQTALRSPRDAAAAAAGLYAGK
jgi:hypothetical protein